MKAVRAARYRKDMSNPETAVRLTAQNRRANICRLAKNTNATIEEWEHHLSMPSTVRRRGLSAQQKRNIREKAKAEQRRRYKEDENYRQRQQGKSREHHLQRPWVMLARKHRRDAKLAGIEDDGSVTAQALGALWGQATTCLYCGRHLTEQNKSVEHMQPMAKGGAHTMANVIIVCRLCNCTKNQKGWEEWVATLPAPYRAAARAAEWLKAEKKQAGPNSEAFTCGSAAPRVSSSART